MHIHMHPRVHKHTKTSIHTNTCTYINTWTHMCTHMCKHIYTPHKATEKELVSQIFYSQSGQLVLLLLTRAGTAHSLAALVSITVPGLSQDPPDRSLRNMRSKASHMSSSLFLLVTLFLSLLLSCILSRRPQALPAEGSSPGTYG